jgi:hypothetical protein
MATITQSFKVSGNTNSEFLCGACVLVTSQTKEINVGVASYGTWYLFFL